MTNNFFKNINKTAGKSSCKKEKWFSGRKYTLKNKDKVSEYYTKKTEYNEIVKKNTTYKNNLLRIEQYTNTIKNTKRKIPNNWRVTVENPIDDAPLKQAWFSDGKSATNYANSYMRSH